VIDLPIFFEKKQLVTPGDLLAEGDYTVGDNAYKENDRIYASRVGLADSDGRKVYVVALKAFYLPKIGDTVIGSVTDVTTNGWIVDIRAPYPAVLKASDALNKPFKPRIDDLTSIYDVDDLLIAKIVAYDRTHDPLLTVREPGLGKITHGQIVKITPSKIPRVIGRKGSMISMIKQETGCRITLGQNGIIVVSGKTPEDERIAIMALRKVEEESHTSGLTDRITEMIKKEKEAIKNA